jgi:hypothetical protein
MRSGRLTIGGWDAETLVNEAGGTPLFVYDSRRIADQVRGSGGLSRSRHALCRKGKPLRPCSKRCQHGRRLRHRFGG